MNEKVHYFVCKGCGESGLYLIRNQCVDCNPRLHTEREAALTMIGKLSSVYEAETVERAIGDWDNFEDWMNTK